MNVKKFYIVVVAAVTVCAAVGFALKIKLHSLIP